MNVEHGRLDAQLGVARLDFGLAALGERTARLREVPDVAVGERDELDLVALRGKQRGRAGELELGIIGMRSECDNSKRLARGGLGWKALNGKDGQQDREYGSATHAAPRAIRYIEFFVFRLQRRQTVRQIKYVTVMLLALAPALLAQRASTGADKGWVALFNGKDLSGWQNYGAEKWTVEKGEILGEAVTKAYGYLGTEKTYKNFEMKGKFKAEGTGNSGIFYHSTINGVNIQGVQVEVDPRPDGHTGGLYESGGRNWLVWPNPAGEKAMKVGEWNDVQFSVQGNHIVTRVNGVLALDYTDPAPKYSDGVIALQLHSGGEGKMRFKDLYVRPLD